MGMPGMPGKAGDGGEPGAAGDAGPAGVSGNKLAEQLIEALIAAAGPCKPPMCAPGPPGLLGPMGDEG